MPASPRESTAVGTFGAPAARIASAIPGISSSSSGRVTSGVASVGVRPVPPVVTTTSTPAATAARIAAPTGASSGTTSLRHVVAVRPQPGDEQRAAAVG